MINAYRTSFFIIIGLIFLLPVFFLGSIISVPVAKSLLLALGVVLAILVFLWGVWRDKKIEIPWHPLVASIAFLPFVYLLSALLSTPSSLALFGYNFEVGTFGFILLSSAVAILISFTFRKTTKILQALSAFFISFSLVAIFVAIKIIFGGAPVWGSFVGIVANPIGKWTDLAIALGLLSIFSIMILVMIPMKKSLRLLTYTVFGLSVVLLIIVNFSTAFIFTLVASLALLAYFLRAEKDFINLNTVAPPSKSPTKRVPRAIVLPVILGVVSLFLLINPMVSSSGKKLGEVISGVTKVSNSEIRPSLASTLSISKAALAQNVLLGSGPNTFGHNWLTYKSVDINSTPFWGITFPSGIGFIPTQIASTGILGVVAWLVFFGLLISLGLKAFAKIPESRALRFVLVSTFFSLVYLWVASFFYPLSFVLLALAFIFSGLFAAACRQPIEPDQTGFIRSRAITFSRNTGTGVVPIFLLVVIVLGSISTGFTVLEKTLSAYHFEKAIDLSNTSNTSLSDVEGELDKAISLSPADVYYATLSRLNFAKARVAASNPEGTPEENRIAFEEAISKSITAARMAVNLNPSGFENWATLGAVYSFLVPEPFSVSGAYENATFAFSEAGKKNPLNPEIPLLLARLELNNKDIEAARSFIRRSLILKGDYADAYIMLTQLEASENNIPEAIASAERLAIIAPNDPAVHFELGLLKYSNKDFEGAVENFEFALTYAPDYANAKYYLALSLVELDRQGEAKEILTKLLETNPDSQELQDTLKGLK